jgi:hypothetical protein
MTFALTCSLVALHHQGHPLASHIEREAVKATASATLVAVVVWLATRPIKAHLPPLLWKEIRHHVSGTVAVVLLLWIVVGQV